MRGPLHQLTFSVSLICLNMDLPTIVFIPGAWHTPEYYGQVIAILQTQGYPITTVSLPSVGGLSTMLDDAAAIQCEVSRLADEGKKVILVMHSYGGIPGTESAKGLAWRTRRAEERSGGIVHLVYLCAYLVKEGMSVSGMANGAEWPQFLKLEVSRTDRYGTYTWIRLTTFQRME